MTIWLRPSTRVFILPFKAISVFCACFAVVLLLSPSAFATQKNLPHYSKDERALSGQDASANTPDIEIIIDLSDQRMQVLVQNALWYDWPISTGRAQKATPSGNFGITRMHRSYFSKTYDFIPMPYSLFFYHGMAIHGTDDMDNLGSPVSRGCVRLPKIEAETLYELVYSFGAERTKIRIKP